MIIIFWPIIIIISLGQIVPISLYFKLSCLFVVLTHSVAVTTAVVAVLPIAVSTRRWRSNMSADIAG